MRIKNVILVGIIILVGVVVSCNTNKAKLKIIDEIIESEPEKALMELERIQRDDLSASDYAYFALLYTQAQIKCGIVVSSDSLVRVAYDVYGRGESGELKKRACFYNAKISYNNGNFKLAMKDALKSYDMAKNEKDSYWIAKSAELIGDIFCDSYNYTQSELYTIESVANYRISNKIANHRYALCDLAAIYLNENKDKEAISLLDSLEYIVKKELPIDTALIEYILMTRYSALLKTNQFEKLKKDLPGYANAKMSDEEKIDISIISSFLLSRDGDTDGASMLLSEAYGLAEDERQRIRVMYAEYQQSLAAEDYKQAALMADSLLLFQSNIAEDVLKESVIGVQRDFYSTKAEYQERKSKAIFYALVIVIIVAIIISALLVWIYGLKIQAKKMELEANLSSLIHFKEQAERIGLENKQLSHELVEKSITLNDLQKSIEAKTYVEEQNSVVIEHLFREKWHTLNMLCNEYFELGDSENTRTVILSNIEHELKKLRTKKSLKDIEVAVDKYMGNIMSLLREECAFLKEDDFIFLSLVFAGLSVRAVCIFMDIKYKLFYLKKSRLSKRIAASTALHKDMYLKRLR